MGEEGHRRVPVLDVPQFDLVGSLAECVTLITLDDGDLAVRLCILFIAGEGRSILCCDGVPGGSVLTAPHGLDVPVQTPTM
jgi:hypothetical protein